MAAINWTAQIDDMVAGHWVNPETGQPATLPYRSIVIDEDLRGREAELVAGLSLGGAIGIVCDDATYQAMGERVARALGAETVILDHPHADEAAVADLRDRTRHFAALVAVGSGTVNDLAKYVTATDGRDYCVFGTAASMNGYTSTTASITLRSGLKVSKPAHAPLGVFIDLGVNAAAPRHLAAAGFADCLCRSTAQVDWWLSHRLFGTTYTDLPFALQRGDEPELMSRAKMLPERDVAAFGTLHRVLTLCGLGVSFTGMSNHGSMGEHQISHYVDCFAGPLHPGSLHGQQVGVATLTMARLQHRMLAMEAPPVVRPTVVDVDAMRGRYGDAVLLTVLDELRSKALDAAGADALNEELARLWPELRHELLAFTLPVERMRATLAAAGGPTTAAELGLDVRFYRQAVQHAREIRRRYSILDLAADAGLLEGFVETEA